MKGFMGLAGGLQMRYGRFRVYLRGVTPVEFREFQRVFRKVIETFLGIPQVVLQEFGCFMKFSSSLRIFLGTFSGASGGFENVSGNLRKNQRATYGFRRYSDWFQDLPRPFRRV